MLNKSRKINLTHTCCLALAITALGTAQAAAVTGPADPSRIDREINTQRVEPSVSPDFVLPKKDIHKPGNEDQTKVFALKTVVISGSTVYNEADLHAMYAGLIGKQVSFADLNEVARQITRKYRDDGYVLSYAALPEQNIKDGRVKIQVIEGFVSDIRIVGDYKDDNGLIKRMAEKIKASRPTNSVDIERYLLLIDDLPGVTARSVLKPSAVPNGSELIITIEDKTVEGAIGADNRGSRYFGRYRGNAVVAANDLLGLHDRTTIRGIMTAEIEELKFFDVTHEEQIGDEGTRLKARYARTSANPGGPIKNQHIEGDSSTYELSVLHPLVRKRDFNINLVGGFAANNSNTDVVDLEVSEDKVRSFNAGVSTDFTDTLAGINQFDFNVTQGINGLGATSEGLGRTRSNGQQDFFRANFTGTRIQDLTHNFSLYGSATGQYTPDSLLASEQFAVGGEAYGRGYDSSEIVGDKGLAGVLELRYSGTGEDLLETYQLYSFYDGGKIWNKAPLVGDPKSDSLASAGGGVRFNLEHDVSGYLEVGFPLTKKIKSETSMGDEPRFFFSLTKRF